MVKRLIVICVILLFAVQGSAVMRGGGGVGGESCYEPDSRIDGSSGSDRRITYHATSYYIEGQSFTAECTVSDATVTISYQVSSVGGNGCSSTGFYIFSDNSADMTTTNICSATGVSITTTGEKTQDITGCDLTATNTYYFGLKCNASDGTSHNFYLYIDDGGNPYAGGQRCYGDNSDNKLDTCIAADDLEFQLYFEE